MKKLSFILLLFISAAAFAQPISPVGPITTNTKYFEPSTKNWWTYHGSLYGWTQDVDSVQLQRDLAPYTLKSQALLLNSPTPQTVLGTYTAVPGSLATTTAIQLKSFMNINTDNTESIGLYVHNQGVIQGAHPTSDLLDVLVGTNGLRSLGGIISTTAFRGWALRINTPSVTPPGELRWNFQDSTGLTKMAFFGKTGNINLKNVDTLDHMFTGLGLQNSLYVWGQVLIPNIGSGTPVGGVGYDANGKLIATGGAPGSVTSVSAGYGMNFTTITTSGAVKADSTVLQTVLNFFPKGDTRWAKLSTTGYVPYNANNGISLTPTSNVYGYNVQNGNFNGLLTSHNLYLTDVTGGSQAQFAASVNGIAGYQPSGFLAMNVNWLNSDTVNVTGNPFYFINPLNATNFYAAGQGGQGYIDLGSQSISPSSTTGRLKIYPDSLNRLSWKNSTYRRTIWVNRAADMTIKAPYRLNPVLADSTDVATSYVPHVAGIAQLQATTSPATTIVVDTVYRGGTFKLVSSSGLVIDNGIIFNSTFGGFYWLRVIDGTYLLPEWYGALGDNSHDDAPAINACIAAANLKKIGVVKLRNVRYKISSSISMLEGVTLEGTSPTANVNAVLGFSGFNASTLVASSSLGSAAVVYDFTTMTNATQPSDANCKNFYIDMALSTAGEGIKFIQPTVGTGGPAMNGVIQSGIDIDNVVVINGKTHGFLIQPNVDGIRFNTDYAYNCAGDGFHILALDTYIETCGGFFCNNGLWTNNTSLRCFNSDFFSNTLVGIYDEGSSNSFIKVFSNYNGHEGILLATGTTTLTANRGDMFEHCIIFGNSETTDNTYADVNINSYSGVGISAYFQFCQFSNSAVAANKPAWSVYTDNKPLNLVISTCSGTLNGLSASATGTLSPNVQQYAVLPAYSQGNGFLGNTSTTLTVNSTAPVISAGNYFITNNSSTTVIANFSGGKTGQIFYVLINDPAISQGALANTSFNFTGNISGGLALANQRTANGQLYAFVCTDGTHYYCTGTPDLNDNTVAINALTVNSLGAGVAHFNSSHVMSSSQVVNGDLGGNAVTYAKIQTQANNTILGNVTGSTAVPTALTASQVATLIASAAPSTIALTQASNDLTAQTTAGNVTTFTVGSSTATFNISAYLNVTAIATDVIQVQVTYTDENNTSQTVSYTTLNSIADSNYNPVTIRAKNGTVITVKTNLTVGAGSVTYDAGARITQL